jgi:membrane fusion protein, heavy metal efflux system
MKNIYTFIILLLIIGCAKHGSHNHCTEFADTIVIDNDKAKVSTIFITKQKFPDSLTFEGMVTVSSNGRYIIAAPADGFITSLKIDVGDYVEKGSVVAHMRCDEMAEIQQDYLCAASRFAFSKEEFKRQGEIALDSDVSLYNMQKAQNDFETAEAAFYKMRYFLTSIGVATGSVKPEKISGNTVVKTGHDGYITYIKASQGQFLRKGECIAELILPDKFVLSIPIFEAYYPYIHTGSTISYYINNDEKLNTSVVHAKGRYIDTLLHTFKIYAPINNPGDEMCPGIRVTGWIVPKNMPSFYCLPSTALLKYKGNSYVYCLKGGYLVKIPVRTGISSLGMVQLINLSDSLLKTPIIAGIHNYLNKK